MAGGLQLLQRKGIWQCRATVFKQGNRRYIWRSLKTTNEHEARIKAEDWQFDVMFAEKLDRSLVPKTVNQLIDDWRKTENMTSVMRVSCSKALRYWRVYIGDQFITEVGDLPEYVKWRRDYWKTHQIGAYKTRKAEPADRMLVLEIRTMRRVFAFFKKKWPHRRNHRHSIHHTSDRKQQICFAFGTAIQAECLPLKSRFYSPCKPQQRLP
jgi:hypothetical protein